VRFLHATGRISVDLAESVIAPVQRKDERPRRALPWDDVQQLLQAVDKTSARGLRDHALLLLMCTYGFGAGEVIRLQLDDIDWLIMQELQVNGRISFKDLGDLVGLSAPAAAERIRRLERRGVITGFRAVLDPNVLGIPILAVIRVNARADAVKRIDEIAPEIPEVIECHRVTGSDSHVIRARLRSTAHLEELLERLLPYGDTITNIVTSSPVYRRPLSRQVLEPDRQ